MCVKNAPENLLREICSGNAQTTNDRVCIVYWNNTCFMFVSPISFNDKIIILTEHNSPNCTRTVRSGDKWTIASNDWRDSFVGISLEVSKHTQYIYRCVCPSRILCVRVVSVYVQCVQPLCLRCRNLSEHNCWMGSNVTTTMMETTWLVTQNDKYLIIIRISARSGPGMMCVCVWWSQHPRHEWIQKFCLRSGVVKSPEVWIH